MSGNKFNGVQPIIILGRPRAGTRFVMSKLNSFPEVSIQSEIPPYVTDKTIEYINELDDYYCKAAKSGDERRERQYKGWLLKKQSLIFELWKYVSQDEEVKPGTQNKYIGYKRPDHEKYISFYEKHLSDFEPLYIYCFRSFIDNYMSINSLWPNKKIETVAKDYRESVSNYLQAKRLVGDRIKLFSVDRQKQEGVNYLKEGIFPWIGLDFENLDNIELDVKPKNATPKNIRRRELTAQECKFLNENQDLNSLYLEVLADA